MTRNLFTFLYLTLAGSALLKAGPVQEFGTAESLLPEASLTRSLTDFLSSRQSEALVVAPSQADAPKRSLLDDPSTALLASVRVAHSRSEREGGDGGYNNDGHNNDGHNNDGHNNDGHNNDGHNNDGGDYNGIPGDGCNIDIYCHDGNCGQAPAATVPEPLTMGLTGAGLIGIYFVRRRRS
ncbi:MAG: PEP-CTERM sorting domain-containing protein [Bryobacteraceae bacterium]